MLDTQSKQIAVPFFRLPSGARLIEASTGRISHARPDDTLVERLVVGIDCRIVQILRYDQDNSGIVVYVGSDARMMSLDQVGAYIQRHI